MVEITGTDADLVVHDAERFVLFVDILGFADLVERVSEGSELLPVFSSDNTSPPDLLRAILGGGDRGKLGAQFAGFHRILKEHLNIYAGYGLTGVSFSDSAFVAFPDYEPARLFAGALMRGLLLAGVPVRMGFSMGSFKGLKFESQSLGSSMLHLSEFAGTGVLRSYQAEKSGSQGLKILMHPSLRRCSGDDRNDPRLVILDEARPSAFAHLSYLDLPLAAPTEDNWKEHSSAIIASFEALQGAVCSLGTDAPESKRHYYWNTLTALNAMRETAMRSVWQRLNDRGDSA